MSRATVLTLLLAPTALWAAPPAGWKTCGGLPDALANTACPSTQSCAKMAWVPSSGAWGCCPFPDGVSCGSYTCCPKGTKCVNSGGGYSVISNCVPEDGSGSAEVAEALPVLQPQYTVVGSQPNTTGDEVCKTGPPLPYDPTRKNILIVGDSVSIGYTPVVAALMNESSFVQHSPWGGDGGAEESLYGFRCIDNLIRAPDGTALSPDILMFNWGLHNSLYPCTNPNPDGTPPPAHSKACTTGQSGPPADYAPYLEKIVAFLQAAPALKSTKLVFAITSPDLCNKPIDDIQVSLNAQAVAIMAKHDIPTIDLYKAITGKCGAVPQHECFNHTGCFCPHCPGPGYAWISNSTIVPALTKML